LSILEFKADVLELRTRINGGRVELDSAIHRRLHRTGKDFTIGNISVAFAHFGSDSLDAEAQVGAWSDQMNFVSFAHPAFQGDHGTSHFRIIHRADVKIKIL